MNAKKTHDLPAPLANAQRRFAQWRRAQKARSRIPDSLWTAAVEIAGTYGLCRTARTLGVEYYALKKRVEQRSAIAAGRCESDPLATFVELPRPEPAGGCDCTLELEDTAGSKMRVHLKTATAPDLAALCRSFWNSLP